MNLQDLENPKVMKEFMTYVMNRMISARPDAEKEIRERMKVCEDHYNEEILSRRKG